MQALITSSFRAVGSVFIPGMFGVFIKSILLTLAALFAFTSIVSGVCIAMIPHIHSLALAWLVPLAGVIGSHVLAWFLFPGIMPLFVAFFDNRIIGLIERHEYPDMPQPAVEPAFWPELWHDARFAAKAVLLNVLVLPLYLVAHVFSPIIFYWLNGYLLGREFFVGVARRHRLVAEAEALRLRHARLVLAAGALLAFLATVPVVNLFAPFWGIAVMTHLYYRLEMDKTR